MKGMIRGVPMGRPRMAMVQANVQSVVWPGAWDQPWIANELVHLGIELELV